MSRLEQLEAELEPLRRELSNWGKTTREYLSLSKRVNYLEGLIEGLDDCHSPVFRNPMKRNPYTSQSRRTRRAFVGTSKASMRRRMAKVRAARNGRKRKIRRYPSRAAFAKGSFRGVRSGRARVIVGCPKGHWSKKRRKGSECNVGMRPYRVKRNPHGATTLAWRMARLRSIKKIKTRRRGNRLKIAMPDYGRPVSRVNAGKYFAIRSGGKTTVFRTASKPSRVGSFSAKGLKNWVRSHNVRVR